MRDQYSIARRYKQLRFVKRRCSSIAVHTVFNGGDGLRSLACQEGQYSPGVVGGDSAFGGGT